jgi:hypothetical protein
MDRGDGRPLTDDDGDAGLEPVVAGIADGEARDIGEEVPERSVCHGGRIGQGRKSRNPGVAAGVSEVAMRRGGGDYLR